MILIDLLPAIFSHIDTGADYKAVTRVCATWRRVLIQSHPTKRSTLCNHLETLIMHWPDKKWDGATLSKNPSISISCVLANPQIKWGWNALSSRITPYEVWSNPRLPWSRYGLTLNPNFTWEMLEKSEASLNKHCLARNPNTPFDKVLVYSGSSLYTPIVYNNRTITLEFVRAHPEITWTHFGLAGNMNIPISAVTEHFPRMIQWYWLSRRSDITIQVVMAYYFGEQQWGAISRNRGITYHDIINNKCNWVHVDVLRNPNLTFEMTQDYQRRCGCLSEIAYWNAISRNPNITPEIVQANIDKPWDWGLLGRNPSMTSDFILANPARPWCLSRISRNRFGR